MARTPQKSSLKRRRRSRRHPRQPSSVSWYVREARGRFNALTRKIAGLPAVVSWDRRQTDRRGSSQPPQIDQRKTERRQKPPFTWDVADFVVWDGAPQESAPTERAANAKKPPDRQEKAGLNKVWLATSIVLS